MNALITEQHDDTRHLILNRTRCSNAFDDALIGELIDAIHAAVQDAATRVILLRANGKHFSAGADLHWMKRMRDYSEAENIKDSRQLATLMQTLYSSTKPTIALVQGAAFGGGAGLVACCDIALAADNARVCFSEVKLGLIPAVISPYVIQAIGARTAKQLFLTAEVLDAQQALNAGLVSLVVPADDLLVQGTACARQIANNAPMAVQAAKRLVNEVQGTAISQALLDKNAEIIAAIRCSTEGQEGLSAFLDKRSPQWSLDNV